MRTGEAESLLGRKLTPSTRKCLTRPPWRPSAARSGGRTRAAGRGAFVALTAVAATLAVACASCAESFTIDPRVEAGLEECGEGFGVFDYESPAGRAVTGCVPMAGRVTGSSLPSEWRRPAWALWFVGGNQGPAGAWEAQHFCGTAFFLNNIRQVAGDEHAFDANFFMTTDGHAATAGVRLGAWERWCGHLPDFEDVLEAERRVAVAQGGAWYVRRAANAPGEVAEIWLRDVTLRNERGETFHFHSGAFRVRLSDVGVGP